MALAGSETGGGAGGGAAGKMVKPWAGTPATLVKSPATTRTRPSVARSRTPQNRSNAGSQSVWRAPVSMELPTRRMVKSPSHSSW